MPVRGGKCGDCGKPTSKFDAVRCQPCNNKYRKGRPVLRKSVKKRLAEIRKRRECPVCSNVKHLNQSEERIFELKSRIELYKQQSEHHYNRLRELRTIKENMEEKIARQRGFYESLHGKAYKKLNELGKLSEQVRREIKIRQHS